MGGVGLRNKALVLSRNLSSREAEAGGLPEPRMQTIVELLLRQTNQQTKKLKPKPNEKRGFWNWVLHVQASVFPFAVSVPLARLTLDISLVKC